MAYYYRTDAFSTWNVADPNFPDELPAYGERIYLAVVDGPVGQNSTKALSPVYEGPFMGVDWLKNWYAELHCDPVFGPNATIIWVKNPPKPQLPEEWKVCGPVVCEDYLCPSYDNGYCMDEKEHNHCPGAKIHKEFSIVRHAKRPLPQGDTAPSEISAEVNPEADTYNLEWRNAFVYWVDWEVRRIGFRIGCTPYWRNFGKVNYSATDDIQAIKMVMDRLAVEMYRAELEETGSASNNLQEYISSILAEPYEWGTTL